VSNDSRTPEDIQTDIEHQREQLAGTIDALAAKLDVKSQAKQKASEVRSRATDDQGRPRVELVAAVTLVVVGTVAIVWWRRR